MATEHPDYSFVKLDAELEVAGADAIGELQGPGKQTTGG
jgi:hypothetical protein